MVDSLLRVIGGHKAESVQLPTQLVLRESSVPGGATPPPAKAQGRRSSAR
jgi:hypothetical protein